MDANLLSKSYAVRRLGKNDIDMIYALSCKNDVFYKYHPPFVTKESILEDLEALPTGKGYEDKYYIGFFEEDTLVAIMDLIFAYPTEDTAFIGFFMMDAEYQSKGIGSKIIGEVCGCLKESGFEKVRLGVDKGNPQSFAFWKKNGFQIISEEKYILMELILKTDL